MVKTFLLETGHTKQLLGYYSTLRMAKIIAKDFGFSVRIITLLGPSFGEGYHRIIRLFDLASNKWTIKGK